MPEAGGHSAEHAPYGGQAVIEGVMMRGRHNLAVAVRKSPGEIVTTVRPVGSLLTRYPFLNRPVLRGVLALWDTLRIGIWAVKWSGETLMDRPASRWTGPLSIAIALVLFLVIPERVAALAGRWVDDRWLNIVDGLVRFAVFGLYFLGISRLKEVQRIFRYHGAEHRTINAFEAGVPLEVPRVQQFSAIHDRCGTNFIVVVLVITLVVFSVVPWSTFVGRMLLRLVLLPLIAGVSYEVLRLGARRESLLLRWLAAPGRWVQRLTTGVPDDEQVEVAIAAFEAVRRAEEAQAAATQSAAADE